MMNTVPGAPALASAAHLGFEQHFEELIGGTRVFVRRLPRSQRPDVVQDIRGQVLRYWQTGELPPTPVPRRIPAAEMYMRRSASILRAALAAASAVAQSDSTGAAGPSGQADPRAIDECGVLVQGEGCVLSAGGGGRYVVPDFGRFRVGDAVRVVGTLDPNCVTICKDADGCIRGGTLYDPAVLPCGTPLPQFPQDLVSGICATASAALLTFALAGLWYTRRAQRARRSCTPGERPSGAGPGRQPQIGSKV